MSDTVNVDFSNDYATARAVKMVRAISGQMQKLTVATVLALATQDFKGVNTFKKNLNAEALATGNSLNTLKRCFTLGGKIAVKHSAVIAQTIKGANDRSYDGVTALLQARIFGAHGLYPKGADAAYTALFPKKEKSDDEKVAARTKLIVDALGGGVRFSLDQLVEIQDALNTALEASANYADPDMAAAAAAIDEARAEADADAEGDAEAVPVAA